MSPSSWERRAALFGCVALFWFSFGCATYSEKLADVRLDADRGAYPAAIAKVNALLDVDSSEESPDRWKDEQPLAALERGVLLQALGEYRLSARDLSNAEAELELLDLQPDAIGQLGNYIYSDSSETYSASPTEKLALNALNIANYLALDELSGAAVEARRFTDMRDYLASLGLDATGTFGAYLAGFTFERLGEEDRALRYYEEALEKNLLRSLEAPIERLAARNPYRGPRIEALLQQQGTTDGERTTIRERLGPGQQTLKPSEILTVIAIGRVPHRVPERIPVGAAIGIAADWITGNSDILRRSVLKVISYPELSSGGSLARGASVQIDGNAIPAERVSHLGSDIRREYALMKPRILGAAVTRMITRAAVAEAARVAGRELGGDNRRQDWNRGGDNRRGDWNRGGNRRRNRNRNNETTGELVGLLAALIAEGSLLALDEPDTRSWSFLPNEIWISREPVVPGRHTLSVEIEGVAERREVEIDVAAGGFSAVLITVPR
ncbi:MAG: hypothetical protein AB8G23_18055 [Myxococcota bacterium]